MSIEIVTHCWAKNVPQYATFLRAQLSSIIAYEPCVEHSVTVCYSEDDPFTTGVVLEYQHRMNLKKMPMENNRLWRRCIGRNAAAMDSKHDVIWFTDCDYLFGRWCLESVVGSWHANQKPDLMWPEIYLANNDKTRIDEFSKVNEKSTGDILPCLDGWVYKRFDRAIGGVQIVSGKYARQHGYLHKSKRWHRPAETPFPDFRDDVVFRETLLKQGRAVPIQPPNLFRMRHTEVGYAQT